MCEFLRKESNAANWLSDKRNGRLNDAHSQYLIDEVSSQLTAPPRQPGKRSRFSSS